MKRLYFTLVAVGGMAALTAGCGVSHSQASAASPATQARVTAQPYVVYVRPGKGPVDGTLYVRNWVGTHAVAMSKGLGGRLVLGPQHTLSLLTYGVDGHSRLASFTRPSTVRPTVVTLAQGAVTNRLHGAIWSRGLWYYQSGPRLVGQSATGNIVQEQNLPNLKPDPVAGVLPAGYKGVTLPEQVGTLQSLLTLSDGHMVGLQWTGRAAAAVDLTTHHVVPIAGYGVLGGGSVGANGDIYVAAWRLNEVNPHIHILTLNPQTLSVTNDQNTGLPVRGTDSVEMQESSIKNIVILIAQGNAGQPQISHLFRVANGQLTSLGGLPANVGRKMTVVGNTVYLYGGAATSHVSLYDLATGQLTRNDPALQTPTGTYVVTVVPPHS